MSKGKGRSGVKLAIAVLKRAQKAAGSSWVRDSIGRQIRELQAEVADRDRYYPRGGERHRELIEGIRALRAARRIPAKRRLDPKRLPNPRPARSIYKPTRGVVLEGMQKGPGHPCDAACKAANHKYRHKFSESVEVIGNADGSVTLRGIR